MTENYPRASKLLEQMRESGRRNADDLRKRLRNWKRLGVLSEESEWLGNLLVDLFEIDANAGLTFYKPRADGTMRQFTRKKPRREQRRRHEGAMLCGAMTRKRTPCCCLPVEGRNRCKYHGGASTGPKTVEGRQRIAESNRRRAQLRKEQNDLR